MEDAFVVADTVSGRIEGEIIRSMLEAHGVQALLSGEGAAAAIGLNVGRLARVDVLVPREQLEQAAAILSDYYAGRLAGEDEDG